MKVGSQDGTTKFLFTISKKELGMIFKQEARDQCLELVNDVCLISASIRVDMVILQDMGQQFSTTKCIYLEADRLTKG